MNGVKEGRLLSVRGLEEEGRRGMIE